MINGRWGSGKTHFIELILEELAPAAAEPKKRHRPLYVSLYGVNSPSEIGDQLFQQIHPVLGHRLTRLAGKIFTSAVKATVKIDIGKMGEIDGSVPTLDLASLLSSSEGRIIVFDDFERAAMKPSAILGYINPLIEHDDCKVLIVADESQIADRDEYVKRKEKTIGQTYLFKADPESIFDVFLDLIDNRDAREFLKKSKPKVIAIFFDSRFDNLRLLKHALWDFERLWNALTRDQQQNERAMNELLLLVCALSVEFRAGNLVPEFFRRSDIAHHIALEVAKPESEQARTLNAVFKKYPSVDFSSTLIEGDDIVDLVTNTRTSPDRIQGRLRQHPYFSKPEDLPSWRALWWIRQYPRDDHHKIVERFRADFASRTFRDEGTINHVIGLALWLAALKLPGWGGERIVGRIKRYIDDVYKGSADKFEDPARSPVFVEAADGLGYMSRDDPRFTELITYHAERRERWRRRAYPRLASDLLKEMVDDSDAFLRDVCFTNAGPERFARLGVLKHIPPRQFATIVSDALGQDQRTLLMALSTRYEQVGAEPELQEEVPWLHQVKTELDKATGKLPIIARDYLSQLVQKYVGKALTAIELRLLPRPGQVSD